MVFFFYLKRLQNVETKHGKDPVKVRYVCQIKTKDIHYLIKKKKLSIYTHSVNICVQLKS